MRIKEIKDTQKNGRNREVDKRRTRKLLRKKEKNKRVKESTSGKLPEQENKEYIIKKKNVHVLMLKIIGKVCQKMK